MCESILIHTSVKLVTEAIIAAIPSRIDFNPHEREARDQEIGNEIKGVLRILIHTSVKLVTA